MSKPFLVLKASAGSGKTYALVRHYLMLCLRSASASYYRQILAITFTNAAAAEMKHRVISRLQEFSESTSDELRANSLFNELRTGIGIESHELQTRASRVLSHMVHNYDLLSISTIDSFTHRLVRSFARELGIDRDFTVEIDSGAFLSEVVDRVLGEAGKDPQLTACLVEFVRSRFEDGENWRIASELLSFSKLLVSESGAPHVRLLSEIDPNDLMALRKQLKIRLNELQLKLTQIGAKLLGILSAAGIGAEELKGASRGPANTIRNWADGGQKEPTLTIEKLARGEDDWIAAKASPELKSKIGAVEAELTAGLSEAISWFDHEAVECKRMELLSRNLYSMALIRYLSSMADELRTEQNIVLIADFQHRIAEVVADSPAPFIFEKIGERYRHVLFDEFQDTSTLQWFNFLPLIENSLSTGNFNLIVGDGKQAIYRWRNGNVEQFVHLPLLPASHQDPFRQALFSDAYEAQVLRTNRRSARQIISFNNKVFRHLAPLLNEHSDVYADLEQEFSRELDGYVRINTIAGKSQSERWPAILEHINGAIEECLEDGYALGDIAILTRKGNGESSVIAEYLGKNNVPVVTRETYLLAHSPLVRWIFDWLGYLDVPSQPYYRTELIVSFQAAFPERDDVGPERFLDTQRRGQARTEDFLEKMWPGYSGRFSRALPAHQLVQELLHFAGIRPNVYLEFLMDQLVQLDRRKGLPLQEIVKWWNESKSSLYIESSDQPNAVKVMTVHKSKGLQFPVVIYPRRLSGSKEQSMWVNPGDLMPDVPTALVSTKMGSDPKGAVFPEMSKEMGDLLLDDLNVFYVANTRAEDRLYLIQEVTKEPGGFEGAYLSLLGMDEATTEQSFGTREPLRIQRVETKDDLTVIDEHPLNHSKPELRFHAPVSLDESEDESPRWFGELMHACLALIDSRNDIDAAILRVLKKEGLSHTDWSVRLKEALTNVVGNDQFKFLFDGTTTALNEREIILPDGHVLRPDRMLRTHSGWMVVDFKTGLPKVSHHDQVKGYMTQIESVSGAPVKGFLLYTNTLELVEVV